MVEAEWPFSLNCVPHVVRAEWPRPKFGRSVGRFTLHGDRIDRPVLTALQAWRIVYEVVSDYLSFFFFYLDYLSMVSFFLFKSRHVFLSHY